MEGLEFILRAISSGGDLATAVVAYFVWRVERRVLRLEIWKKGLTE